MRKLRNYQASKAQKPIRFSSINGHILTTKMLISAIEIFRFWPYKFSDLRRNNFLIKIFVEKKSYSSVLYYDVQGFAHSNWTMKIKPARSKSSRRASRQGSIGYCAGIYFYTSSYVENVLLEKYPNFMDFNPIWN